MIEASSGWHSGRRNDAFRQLQVSLEGQGRGLARAVGKRAINVDIKD
jgi:hypothetical protein